MIPQKKSKAKKLILSQLIFILIINMCAPFIVFFALQLSKRYSIIGILVTASIVILLVFLDLCYIVIPFRHLEANMRNSALFEMFKEHYTASPKSDLIEMYADISETYEQYIAQDYQSDVLKQQAELMALQSQINPHFLYNTLDSIRGVALMHDITQIADMTEALAKLFRRMTANEGMLVTLKEEFQSISYYMLIQQFRFNNRISYSIPNADDNIMSFIVPNLIIQPVVENAVIHGLEQKSKGGHVTISGYATQTRLVIQVEDNGIGIPKEKLDELNKDINSIRPLKSPSLSKRRRGIGLANINRRIKLHYGNEFGLSIMSTPNVSTSVEIVLPLIIPNGDI